jgi:hypothetical protein
MRSHPVALQILRRDQSVGLQVVAQHTQIDAFECTIGLRGVDQEGMTLLVRPAGQVAGAKVARKSLLAGDLCECIGAVAQPAIGVERTRHRVRRRIKLQRCGIGSNQVEAKGNARSNAAVEQFSARDRGPHAALPSSNGNRTYIRPGKIKCQARVVKSDRSQRLPLPPKP